MKLMQKFMWSFVVLAVIAVTKIENPLIDIMPAIHKVPTSHKVAALTFDDGPLQQTTPEILTVLHEKNVKATFFVIGENIARVPELVAQEIAEGHEVGSHTYTHPHLYKLSKNAIEKELDMTDNLISQHAPKPTLFRPPQGKYNPIISKISRNHGYTTILWSIDTLDWQRPPVGQVVNTVLKNIKPGSIILLHDGVTNSPTPEALGFIIDGLKERGYELVTVSELLQYYEESP
ncbi:MAG: polysaccharide deacetylase family protein [Pelosinus sp.]|nr:polysaccharide deacetylase family protein [Pelosinus sp.]